MEAVGAVLCMFWHLMCTVCHILHFFLTARSRTPHVCLIPAPNPVEECPGLLSSATGASRQPATAEANSTTPEGAGTEGNPDPAAEGGSTPAATGGQDEGEHNSASTTSVARSGEFTGHAFSSHTLFSSVGSRNSEQYLWPGHAPW